MLRVIEKGEQILPWFRPSLGDNKWAKSTGIQGDQLFSKIPSISKKGLTHFDPVWVWLFCFYKVTYIDKEGDSAVHSFVRSFPVKVGVWECWHAAVESQALQLLATAGSPSRILYLNHLIPFSDIDVFSYGWSNLGYKAGFVKFVKGSDSNDEGRPRVGYWCDPIKLESTLNWQLSCLPPGYSGDFTKRKTPKSLPYAPVAQIALAGLRDEKGLWLTLVVIPLAISLSSSY